MLTLTAIYAHPDDETFSAGGTFAKYAAAGVRCTVFVATDGDAGKTSALKVASKEELGRIRREELRVAARILGIAEVEFAGHPDGALGQVDQESLIGQVVAHVRRERPQVVLTFGPEGAPNTHRDHKAISRAATAAFFLAGNPTAFADQLTAGAIAHAPSRLFYVTWPDPPPGAALPARGVPATTRIDVRDFRDVELRAWRAHVSQQMHDAHFQESGATDEELFACVSGARAPDVTTDFFSGLG